LDISSDEPRQGMAESGDGAPCFASLHGCSPIGL
jgi:hypothetical protein